MENTKNNKNASGKLAILGEMYDFSDAWFLTAFTQNEINQALKRLIPVGYIETNGKKYRVTEKAYELTNCVAYERAGMFT